MSTLDYQMGNSGRGENYQISNGSNNVQSDDLIWTMFIEEAVTVLLKWSMDHDTMKSVIVWICSQGEN